MSLFQDRDWVHLSSLALQGNTLTHAFKVNLTQSIGHWTKFLNKGNCFLCISMFCKSHFYLGACVNVIIFHLQRYYTLETKKIIRSSSSLFLFPPPLHPSASSTVTWLWYFPYSFPHYWVRPQCTRLDKKTKMIIKTPMEIKQKGENMKRALK